MRSDGVQGQNEYNPENKLCYNEKMCDIYCFSLL